MKNLSDFCYIHWKHSVWAFFAEFRYCPKWTRNSIGKLWPKKATPVKNNANEMPVILVLLRIRKSYWPLDGIIIKYRMKNWFCEWIEVVEWALFVWNRLSFAEMRWMQTENPSVVMTAVNPSVEILYMNPIGGSFSHVYGCASDKRREIEKNPIEDIYLEVKLIICYSFVFLIFFNITH